MKRKSAPKDAKANNGNDNITPPTKHEMALEDLLKAGTTGISKLTELASYGETALPTTVSELILTRGFLINKDRRDHIHQHGVKTYFTWYWLADQEQAQKAVAAVNHFRRRRFAKPLSESLVHSWVQQFPPVFGGAA